jgi:transcriptional regulator with XRE-family HTH domain
MESFSAWLENGMQKRGMTQSDLSRASGLSTATVANLINGRRKPGPDACTKIARALKLPEDAVFRAAGLLLPQPATDETLERINHLYHELQDPNSKQRALEYVELLLAQEEKGKRNAINNPAVFLLKSDKPVSS